MNEIVIDEEFVLEYIREMIHDASLELAPIKQARYHHNTGYCNAPSSCKYGILTANDLKQLKIRDFTEEDMKKLADTDLHINGVDSVSLSVVGLQDLYPNEYEYNPFLPYKVDFLVSSDIQAYRSSIHYGNEFLAFRGIKTEKLRSVDIRLLELIKDC